jgi:hypothetical protein
MPRPAVRLVPVALLAVLAVACDGDGDAPRPAPFTWRGELPAGAWVRVRDLNGTVRVARASGREVLVTATQHFGPGRPERVRLVATPDPAGVTVCALWGREGGTCTARDYRSARKGRWPGQLFGRGRPVRVDFTVALPPGVRLDASTVNGGVVVADADADVRVRTVNGSVTVDARGAPVQVESVNGAVRARLAELPSEGTTELRTVNGSVTALLPDAVDAEVALETVNGRVSSDWPLTGGDPASRRALRGTLGAGGARLALRTVNGSARLVRADGAGEEDAGSP